MNRQCRVLSVFILVVLVLDCLGPGAAEAQLVGEKLQVTTLPSVELEDVSFYEALSFLQAQSRAHDPITKDEGQRGIDLIVIDPENKLAEKRIDLKLGRIKII